MVNRIVLLNRGIEYLNKNKIKQFSIRSFVYQLEISRAKFYNDYLYYMDYFKDLIEYFFKINTPVDQDIEVYEMVEKDLILIATNEILFINLLFITRKQSKERNNYLKNLYFERIINLLIQSNLVDPKNDTELKKKIVKCYADYLVLRIIPWIEKGSLKDNFSQILDLSLLGKQLFYPNKNFFLN